MKQSKLTLKTQYKTAGAFYAIGSAFIVASELKNSNGQYVFMARGRDNLKKVGGTVFVTGNVLHILGNVRVAGRAIKWVAKKVFK